MWFPGDLRTKPESSRAITSRPSVASRSGALRMSQKGSGVRGSGPRFGTESSGTANRSRCLWSRFRKKPRHLLSVTALLYLFIGLFIFVRRWNAPRAIHFYVFCLVSFVLYSFHYTGKLNSFDWT